MHDLSLNKLPRRSLSNSRVSGVAAQSGRRRRARRTPQLQQYTNHCRYLLHAVTLSPTSALIARFDECLFINRNCLLERLFSVVPCGDFLLPLYTSGNTFQTATAEKCLCALLAYVASCLIIKIVVISLKKKQQRRLSSFLFYAAF